MRSTVNAFHICRPSLAQMSYRWRMPCLEKGQLLYTQPYFAWKTWHCCLSLPRFDRTLVREVSSCWNHCHREGPCFFLIATSLNIFKLVATLVCTWWEFKGVLGIGGLKARIGDWMVWSMCLSSCCHLVSFFLFPKQHGSFLLVPPGHLVSLVFLFLCLLVPHFLCDMS